MKVHVFAPSIVIGITFYWFAAGLKLVRSWSNYFWRTDNANFVEVLVRSRSNYFAHDGQHALTLVVNIGPVPNHHVSRTYSNKFKYAYTWLRRSFVNEARTCSDRTNSRKAPRGGSVSTHINRRKSDFVHRSFTPFRDITSVAGMAGSASQSIMPGLFIFGIKLLFFGWIFWIIKRRQTETTSKTWILC